MSEEKHLGKISHVSFGLGGYQEAMFGISLSFEFSSGSYISDYRGFWDPEIIECGKHAQWTEETRDKKLAGMCRFVSKLLKEAKVSEVSNLKGKPVEIIIEGSTLKSWRILTEVL